MFDLTEKIAAITEAASGIGAATACRFAAAGATVVLADVADASELAASIRGHFVHTNVASEPKFGLSWLRLQRSPAGLIYASTMWDSPARLYDQCQGDRFH
jgi:NAD(P)-dependent dehydrogenase (short-subunit alcohol dehydrogenase family)